MPPTPPQLIDHWPVFGLALQTARLALRLPREEDKAALGRGSRRGRPPPGRRPFLTVPVSDRLRLDRVD